MKVPLPQTNQETRVLADWVAASLREAILDGYFEPGEKLDQDLVAEQLQVSRTPVREALKRLESEGFLEVRPHYGAFIADVSPQDIREVYEVRMLIEPEVVRQVTPLIPDTVLSELERSLDETLAQLEAGDSSLHFETDVRLHETIAEFVENKLMKEVLDGLANRITIVRRFAQSRPGPRVAESLKEHHAILQAMRQRNSGKAAELMRMHLETSCRRILELAQ